jgi:hypothetical protein
MTVAKSILPKPDIGNEYTLTLWLYIKDLDYNFAKPKHILHIGDIDAKYVVPGLWIYPNDNHIMVQLGTKDKSQRCDIKNIPLQRWNHIALIMNNTTIDTYINGKLTGSCKLNQVYQVPDGDIYLNQFEGFNGEMSDIYYVNKAVSSAEIEKWYVTSFEGMVLSKKIDRIMS